MRARRAPLAQGGHLRAFDRPMTCTTDSDCHAHRWSAGASGAPGQRSKAPSGMWSEGCESEGSRCGLAEPAIGLTGIVRSTCGAGQWTAQAGGGGGFAITPIRCRECQETVLMPSMLFGSL